MKRTKRLLLHMDEVLASEVETLAVQYERSVSGQLRFLIRQGLKHELMRADKDTKRQSERRKETA